MKQREFMSGVMECDGCDRKGVATLYVLLDESGRVDVRLTLPENWMFREDTLDIFCPKCVEALSAENGEEADADGDDTAEGQTEGVATSEGGAADAGCGDEVAR